MADLPWLTTSAGIRMPTMIYGTAWKKERTADLVVTAVQAGFRGIDTACQPRHYDESLVGEALRRLCGLGIRRDDLFVQTKFTPLAGQDPANVPYHKAAPVQEQVKQSFAVSQKNLQCDTIDSLVLHSPLAPHTQLMAAWRAMEALHAAGGVGQLGISNCYHVGVIDALYADAHVKPAVVQNRFYRETVYDIDLRRWCAGHKVIYQSFWTLTANPHLLFSSTIRHLAQRHQKTEAQVFFRYLSQAGIVPLTGTCSRQHMIEDLAVFEFDLSPKEMNQMEELIRSV